VTLNVTFAVWDLSNSHPSENIACINYDVFRLLVNRIARVACSFT